MISTRFHDFIVSKKSQIFEADKDNDKKEEPTVKYQENMKIKDIPGGESAYRSYMAMFVESLNCLESIYSLSKDANPENQYIKSYSSDRRDIGVAAENSEEGVKKSWDKLTTTAKNLLSVIPSAIKNNRVIKEYKAAQAKLDAEFKNDSQNPKYISKSRELREEYSAKFNPAEQASLTEMSKACKLYFSAIENFKQGANAEIEYIIKESKEDKSVSKEFYKKAGGAIESLVLSKKLASKSNLKNESEGYAITEDLKKGFKKIFGKDKNEPLGGLEGSNLQTLADNIMSSLFSLGMEIDNVINWKASIQGKESQSGKRAAKQAEESAGEMIDFLRNSVEYVRSVESLLNESPLPKTRHAEIKNKLDKIASELLNITRKDGILSKWKNEVLGEKREKTVSASYLQMGRDKMLAAQQIMEDLAKSKELDAKIKQFEPQELLKKALGQSTDSEDSKKSGMEPARIRKRNQIKSLVPKSPEKDKDFIKLYQEKLKELGYLDSDYKEGVYDESTQKANGKAMRHLGLITGKVYDNSEEALRDFKIDLLYYSANRDKIRELLNQ